MATTTWDIAHLSGYLNVPVQTLAAVIDAPTTKLVQSLLEAITRKAHEHEEAQADKLRLEIELENAVRSAETKCQVLKATIDKALNDVTDLREKLISERKWYF
jgi:nucleoprotein TPR